MQPVSLGSYYCSDSIQLVLNSDYPRTLREWDRRFEANVTQDLFVRDYSSLTSDRDAEYEIFKRKWRYLFAYASAGFAKGWITCHMITFIRAVSLTSCGILLNSDTTISRMIPPRTLVIDIFLHTVVFD